jgi:hypothetical protein
MIEAKVEHGGEEKDVEWVRCYRGSEAISKNGYESQQGNCPNWKQRHKDQEIGISGTKI